MLAEGYVYTVKVDATSPVRVTIAVAVLAAVGFAVWLVRRATRRKEPPPLPPRC